MQLLGAWDAGTASSVCALFLALMVGCGARDLPVGAPCQVGECEVGAVCARIDDEGDGTDACISLCNEDFQCPLGGTCWWSGTGADRGCFPGGDTQLGEACTHPVECTEGLICLFRDAELTGGRCMPYCEPLACSEGQPCVETFDCTAPLVCTLAYESAIGWSGECAQPCPAEDGQSVSLCETGELCAPVAEGASAWGCYPGGDVGAGESCEYAADCVRGHGCAGGTEGCVKACRTAVDCAAGEPCVDGFCSG